MCIAKPCRTLVCLVAVAMSSLSGGADTIFVDERATSGANNGSNWLNAFTNLQSALDAAEQDDEIWVADGTYYPTVLYPDSSDERRACFRPPAHVMIFGGFRGADFSTTPPTDGESDRVLRKPEVNLTILDGDLLKDKNPNNFAYQQHLVR